MSRRSQSVWCWVVVLLGLTACATLQAPQSKLSAHVGKSNVTPGELRIRVRALASEFSGRLENLGDALIEQQPDSLHTRMIATRFKINAIPAMQAALFQPDPLAALIDAWALLDQLQEGAKHVGLDAQRTAFAREQFGNMEEDLEAIWRQVAGRTDVSADRKIIQDWAAAHPLQGTSAARVSTAGILANLTAREGVSLTGAAAHLIEDTADLTARLDLQTAFLPKQARWQAEYLALEALTTPAADETVPNANRLLSSFATLAETAPALLARERSAAFDDLHRERLDAQGFLEQQRQATMQDLRQERDAVLNSTNAMVGQWEDRTFAAATRLLDRAFRWLCLLVGFFAIGVLGAALILVSYARRRPSRRGGGLVERPA